MSDIQKKPDPNYGAVYAAAMYPEIAAIGRKHGYAVAVHGSLARDLDLIAIPWVDECGDPQDVIDEILRAYAVELIGDVGQKPHGRIAFTLSCGWGHCAIDMQFMPKTAPFKQSHTPGHKLGCKCSSCWKP